MTFGNFSVEDTSIAGIKLIASKVFSDNRGLLAEQYAFSSFRDMGIAERFVQMNESVSNLGVLRGIHVNVVHPQSKILRVLQGKIFDVIVDLRPSSATFGKYESFFLDQELGRSLYIPPGCGHGFLSLEDGSLVQWQCPCEYAPNEEIGIRWNDPALKIAWPNLARDFIICERDSSLPCMSDPDVLLSLESLRGV